MACGGHPYNIKSLQIISPIVLRIISRRAGPNHYFYKNGYHPFYWNWQMNRIILSNTFRRSNFELVRYFTDDKRRKYTNVYIKNCNTLFLIYFVLNDRGMFSFLKSNIRALYSRRIFCGLALASRGFSSWSKKE